MKTRELTDVEKFYAKAHRTKESAAEMAKKMKTAKKSVEMFLDTLPATVEVEHTHESEENEEPKKVEESSANIEPNIQGAEDNVKGDKPNNEGHYIMTGSKAMQSSPYNADGSIKERVVRERAKSFFDRDVVPLESKE